jgi:hypothetical protein
MKRRNRFNATMPLVAGALVAPFVLVLSAGPAGASTAYTPSDTPVVASIADGATAAPWNEYQGDPASSAYPQSDLLDPTYVPGGPTTGSGTASSPTEPNVAVFPSASSSVDVGTTSGGVTGEPPYPTGTVGTPGTLDGYCGTGDQASESSGSPATQPVGTTLPLGPAYFPHIVRDPDGDLTGYFDYRPKDADEAIVAGTSSDNGQSWTYDGEALEQNPDYCPSADINDDGEGHANIITVGGRTFLYTLPRAAGDMQGVGMIVHEFSPSEADPLSGLPATEETGIDPDAFATSSSPIATTGSASLSVTATGSVGSTERLVTGGFIDLTQDATPTPADVINCTVTTGSNTMTGCTAATAITVNTGDLIEQVIGYVSAQSGLPLSVPAGPNTTTGDGGLAAFDVSPSAAAAASTSGSSNLGFTLPLTGSTFNNNAPNRAYINGTAVYCAQSNNNPTTEIENCTTGPKGSSLPLAVGQLITGDPIIPAAAYASDPSAGGTTTGLVSPDGIVGVLPTYPNDGTVPTGATFVMYTEKELNYYLAGDSTSAVTFSSSTAFSIPFIAGPYISQDMPASGPWTVEMGGTSNAVVTPPATDPTAIVPVTCTTLNETSASLGGCTVPAAYNGWTAAKKSYIAAAGATTASPSTPGATAVPPDTLALTGEGSASNIAKLYKNNEDLAITRVAWTTDGTTFSDVGLANQGIISGNNNCGTTDPTVCTSTGSYDDLSNPATNVSPSNLDAYSADDAANGTGTGTGGTGPGTDLGGSPDLTEMRWLGSAGSIIVNPDGSYGLFLSGAWAADGDSDAFNQVFYATSTDGEYWSVPTPVVSTDYSFSASVLQDNQVGDGQDSPLGISAYYSGRAYAPSVVQNPDGSLTMLFSGDRLPKSIAPAGTVLGTNPSAQYTVGATDPALYRNILAVTFVPSSNPGNGAPEAPVSILFPLLGGLGFGVAAFSVNRRRRRSELA